MSEDAELPDEIFGFAGWLLWLVATRATALVDRAYDRGPARPSKHYGMAAGHHVPTPSLIAWLLVSAEAGVPVDSLPRHDPRLDNRHKVLRTLVGRALTSEPRAFKENWVRDLAALCGFSMAESTLLLVSRGDGPYPVDPPDLRRAIERTLRARGQEDAAGGPAVALRTLPRDIRAFTGRHAELDRLLHPGGSDGGPGIWAIDGMAGVGKSAFAVHAAHLLAPAHPDGQSWFSLHAHTAGQRPAAPADALASLLLSTGLRAEQIPAGVEPRSRLWRDWLAGRRVLLVLDDASGHDQVRPLLPGAGGCLVLVTSRRRITELEDARTVSLDVLEPDEAARMFARLADRPDVPDGADPAGGAVADLVAQCAYLPLAIAVLARQLHHHPAWSVTDLAAEFAATHSRLGMLSGPGRSVAAAFDLSYADLPPPLARLFRLLAVHPGTEYDAWNAAALAGADLVTARRMLNALYDHHLLAELVPGRFLCHDLLREYATRLWDGDVSGERDAALRRLTDYYLRAAVDAGRRESTGHLYVPFVDAITVTAEPLVPDLTAAGAGARWLAAERLNLDAVIRQAGGTELRHALAIMMAIHQYMNRSRPDHGMTLARGLLASAVAEADRLAQGWAMLGLARFQNHTGALHASTASAARALALFRPSRDGGRADRMGEADALVLLGHTRYLTDDNENAARYLRDALALYLDLGDAVGEAEALGHLGYVQYLTEEYEEAAASLEQAVRIFTAHGDERAESAALNSLSSVQRETGDHAGAMASLRRALAASQAAADPTAEAWIRSRLGLTQCVMGQPAEAEHTLVAAVDLHREGRNAHGEATAINYLGLAQRMNGNAAAAIASQQRAVELYRECGSRLGEGNAWQELGLARHQAGDAPGALQAEQRALEIYQGIGQPVSQAETLNNIGELHLADVRAGSEPGADGGMPAVADAVRAARVSYEQAVTLLGDLPVPGEQARAFEGIGRCCLLDGNREEAIGWFRRAHALYQRLGVPDADRVAALLASEGPPA